MKKCRECQDGEHENYDDNVKLVVIKDPDTNRIVKRCYMCDEHRTMYLDDGYDVHIQ